MPTLAPNPNPNPDPNPNAGETMELVLSDGFPGAFRWSARPALRYAISPDFCAAMRSR